MPALIYLAAALLLANADPPPASQAEGRDPPQSRPQPLERIVPLAETCCKTCRSGKACGDSCIKRDETCTKPPGCACDANKE